MRNGTSQPTLALVRLAQGSRRQAETTSREYAGNPFPCETEPLVNLLDETKQKEGYMFAKVAFGFAVVLATASGAVAATKTHIAPSRDVQGVYDATGACARWFSWPCGLSTFELNRGWAHGRYQ